MKMLNILLKFSHHVSGKPGSINPGTQQTLLLSTIYRASFQFATFFITELWVCDGKSLEKS